MKLCGYMSQYLFVGPPTRRGALYYGPCSDVQWVEKCTCTAADCVMKRVPPSDRRLTTEKHGLLWGKGGGGRTVGQEAHELICENARKKRQKEAITLWTLFSPKQEFVLIKVLKKKNDFWPFLHFWPWKGHFGLLGPKNSPPSSQTATYWKTKGIQSYLGIWGRYDQLSGTRLSPKNKCEAGCPPQIVRQQLLVILHWRHLLEQHCKIVGNFHPLYLYFYLYLHVWFCWFFIGTTCERNTANKI